MAGRRQVAAIPGLGARISAILRTRKMTQGELAARAEISRQTLNVALNTDHATPHIIERIAGALRIRKEALMGEQGYEGQAGPEGGEVVPLDRRSMERPLPRVADSPRLRIWQRQFEIELIKAGASEDFISEALDLVRAPQVFTFYSGGAPKELSEEDAIKGMEAIADVVRKELKSRKQGSNKTE